MYYSTKEGEGMDLFWSNEMTPDSYLAPQEEMKITRHGKYIG